MSSAHSDPMVGRVLDDRYVIRSRIARGGMATVYLANDSRLERRVAIKIMHGHLAEENNFRRRFVQEARSAARLSHPNVVNVFDQGEDDEMAYLVMEYLPGITLRDLLKQQQSLTVDQAYEISENVLAGLAAAHAAGIVHRDMKPENVLLADDGRIKLSDFGLARVASANTTTGQALLGTIAYLSPELVTRGIADTRSDIYAFGIMLFEMLTGEQPFTGEQPMQIAYQHAHDDVPAPSTRVSEATPELDELVRWTTIRDPEARPRDAGMVLDRLRQLRASPGGVGYQPTRVLTEHVSLTPATTVLNLEQQQRLRDQAGSAQPVPQVSPPTPLTRVQAAAARRRRSGSAVTAIVAVLALGLGVGGWWLGQGPGANVPVPSVTDLGQSEIETLFAEHELVGSFSECSSLTVPAGKAVSSSPAEGERIEKASSVEVCLSSGPAILEVPELINLTLEDAQQQIESAKFRFGKVTEERFTDVKRGLVIQTLDADNADLGESYPEQGVINLVLSAGTIPDVSGKTLDEATKLLGEAGLTAPDTLRAESYHSEIPKGNVVRALAQTDSVVVGDSIGLEISLGPELFPVPDVVGNTVNEAIARLREAGFTPRTLVPEQFRNAIKAASTDPEAGSKIEAGGEVSIGFIP